MYAQHAGTRRWQKIINHENTMKSNSNILNATLTANSGNPNQTAKSLFYNSSQSYNYQVDDDDDDGRVYAHPLPSKSS